MSNGVDPDQARRSVRSGNKLFETVSANDKKSSLAKTLSGLEFRITYSLVSVM